MHTQENILVIIVTDGHAIFFFFFGIAHSNLIAVFFSHLSQAFHQCRFLNLSLSVEEAAAAKKRQEVQF